MDVKAQKILLAGLLHDIGKFYQSRNKCKINSRTHDRNTIV
jgi:HD superfamily phosphodiesterase